MAANASGRNIGSDKPTSRKQYWVCVLCDDGGDGIKLVQLAPLRWKKPRRIFMTDLFADFRDGSNEWDNIS